MNQPAAIVPFNVSLIFDLPIRRVVGCVVITSAPWTRTLSETWHQCGMRREDSRTLMGNKITSPANVPSCFTLLAFLSLSIRNTEYPQQWLHGESLYEYRKNYNTKCKVEHASSVRKRAVETERQSECQCPA